MKTLSYGWFYEDVDNKEQYYTYATALAENQRMAEACGCPECGSDNVQVEEVGEVDLMQLNTVCRDCKNRFQVAPFNLKHSDNLQAFREVHPTNAAGRSNY